MKKLLELGNDYAANSDWTDFALAKFCLCAMGILIGIGIPVKQKKCFVKNKGDVRCYDRQWETARLESDDMKQKK